MYVLCIIDSDVRMWYVAPLSIIHIDLESELKEAMKEYLVSLEEHIPAT